MSRVDFHGARSRLRMPPELREILSNVLEVKSISEQDSAETIATAIAIPAEGPSFGIAPSGTCTCKS